MGARRRWRPCDVCGCPLVRLWVPGGRQTIEVRKRCAGCSSLPLATPCAVRECTGSAVDVDAAVPLCMTCLVVPQPSRVSCACGECKTCRQREWTRAWRARNAERFRDVCRAQEARNRDKRLATRKEKRQAEGDRMRAMERVVYARRKERTNAD